MQTNSAVGLRYAGYYPLSDLTVLLGKPEEFVRAELTKLEIRLMSRFGVEAVSEQDVRRLMLCGPTAIGKFIENQPGHSWSRLRTLMHRAIAETGLDLAGKAGPNRSRDRGICYDANHRCYG